MNQSKMEEIFYPPESIYDIIPKEEFKEEKPPRYISKHRQANIQEMKANKNPMKTMGPAKVEVPSPEKYLQKRSKEPKLPDTDKNDETTLARECTTRKPKVPLRTEKPVMGIHTEKNFIKTNVIENIMAVPKQPPPVYADSKKGDKHMLENSGLVPKYIRKKDFGETPQYLQKRMEEARKAQQEYDRYVQEQMKQGAMQQLPDEQRQATLEGLRMTWAKLNQQYLGLPLVIDTESKKRYKEDLEANLKQLEGQISLLEKYETIYIANN